MIKYEELKTIENKNKIFQSMHLITGLKSMLLKIIARLGAKDLPLKRADIPYLDMTNSDDWHKGHMKASYRTKQDKFMQKYQPGERFDLEIGRPMQHQY
jgi:hypothetical protein